MNLVRYSYLADASFSTFEFESTGLRGCIQKRASFTLLRPNLYSFGFGDVDNRSGYINDTIVSNNGDSKIVLATVAAIIHDFTQRYCEAWVIVQGSTPARTRLYQINLNAYWLQISQMFEVLGLRDNEWKPVRKGMNYNAFACRRKSPQNDQNLY